MIAVALMAMVFVFVGLPVNVTHAEKKPLDWKLTYAEGNHLLKGHLNANAKEIAKGKTTIHIHGQEPIVIEQGKPNVKATLKGLEEGKSYEGTITFEGVVAGQKVTVYECFTLYAATPGKSLNQKHILKYGECKDDNHGEAQPGGGDQPGDQPNDGDEKDDVGESVEKPDSPKDSIDNKKGGKMPDTATGQPTQMLIGSLVLLVGAALWKFRGVAQN